MAPRTRVLPACLAASAVLGAVHLLGGRGSAEDAFVTPNLRGEAAAAMAAAVVAGSLAAPGPAEAVKFSVFGFGSGTASDAYAQIDSDQKNPYSQFSSGKNRIFNEQDSLYLARKKIACQESFKRLDKIPPLLEGRKSEDVKSMLTTQVGMLRQNMEYITAGGPPMYRNDDQTTPAYQKANAFFQDLSDLLVYDKSKRWPEAKDSYAKAMTKLGDWKQLVKFDSLPDAA